MKEILNNNTLSVMIFLYCVLFIGAILCIIRDNIVNDKKGLNPQIAMIVSLGVFSIGVLTVVCRCIYLFSSFIITKILTKMIRIDMLWTIVGAIVIGVATTIYWLIKIDDISETAPNEDQTYESDKNDEIEPHEEASVETVNSVPEEHTNI
jgi:hypothetical protein